MMPSAGPPYKDKYPGTWGMRYHDGHEELQRWLSNWARDKDAYLAPTEWLTITEHSWTHRGKTITAYEGVIGSDHHEIRRTVKFETGAPPPPTFFTPVKQKYEPPPPEPAG